MSMPRFLEAGNLPYADLESQTASITGSRVSIMKYVRKVPVAVSTDVDDMISLISQLHFDKSTELHANLALHLDIAEL